jgi:hypothetical protein
MEMGIRTDRPERLIPDFRVVARFGAPYLCEVKPVTFGDAPDLLDATTNEMTVALGGVQPPLGKDFHDIMIAGTNLDSWWTAWVGTTTENVPRFYKCLVKIA